MTVATDSVTVLAVIAGVVLLAWAIRHTARRVRNAGNELARRRRAESHHLRIVK